MRGLTLLDHLVGRLGPGADDLALNIHSVWALLTARRNLLEDDLQLSRSLAGRVTTLLDAGDLAPRARSEIESVRAALRLAGVQA